MTKYEPEHGDLIYTAVIRKHPIGPFVGDGYYKFMLFEESFGSDERSMFVEHIHLENLSQVTIDMILELLAQFDACVQALARADKNEPALRQSVEHLHKAFEALETLRGEGDWRVVHPLKLSLEETLQKVSLAMRKRMTEQTRENRQLLYDPADAVMVSAQDVHEMFSPDEDVPS